METRTGKLTVDPLFKRKFKGEFDFHNLVLFVRDIEAKYGLGEIRFHPSSRGDLFTEQQLTHLCTTEDLNGFVSAWKKYKDIVKKVTFDQFSKADSANQKIRITIDLDNNSIFLDLVKGVSSKEIEIALENSFGPNLLDKHINKQELLDITVEIFWVILSFIFQSILKVLNWILSLAWKFLSDVMHNVYIQLVLAIASVVAFIILRHFHIFFY